MGDLEKNFYDASVEICQIYINKNDMQRTKKHNLCCLVILFEHFFDVACIIFSFLLLCVAVMLLGELL